MSIRTSLMLSLEAKAMMSAHETTPLQLASSLVFALLMTSNPSRLGLLIKESFSGLFPDVKSKRIDPSQP